MEVGFRRGDGLAGFSRIFFALRFELRVVEEVCKFFGEGIPSLEVGDGFVIADSQKKWNAAKGDCLVLAEILS